MTGLLNPNPSELGHLFCMILVVYLHQEASSTPTRPLTLRHHFDPMLRHFVRRGSCACYIVCLVYLR